MLKQYAPRFYARGHFLFSAALRFVTQEVTKIRGKKSNIAYDAFRTLILTLFKDCCCNDPQMQRLYMQAEVAAKDVIKIKLESDRMI